MTIEHAHPHPHSADDPSPDQDSQRLELALRTLLIRKGVFTALELQQALEKMDQRGPERGAEIIALAWVDEEYRQHLLREPNEAVKRFGIDMGATELAVVENTPTVHNVIVCTLCSCYPRMILGIPPAWYKSVEYRSRVVREPRQVLAEFGLALPVSSEVHVHDSTADLRYLVLPVRPKWTDGLNESELAALVSRDAMIGVGTIRDEPQQAA